MFYINALHFKIARTINVFLFINLQYVLFETINLINL